MARKQKAAKLRQTPRAVLKLAGLDQPKQAVLNCLSSIDAQRGYRQAIAEFIEWYGSEPRLSFDRSVVFRYRMNLESRNLAPGTVKAAPWCGAPPGLRGRRLRTSQPGPPCGNPPGEGREETRSTLGKLVDRGAGGQSRLQRAEDCLRRCSLAFMISLMSPAGRISKMLPYVSAGC